MKKIFVLATLYATTLFNAHSQVVISQVYGAGGNSGAIYQNDYIELFNQSTAANASLSGYSLQYLAAGSSATSYTVSVILSGTIGPLGYYLIKLAGGPNGSALPSSDATGTTNLSATTGKIALVNGTTALSSTVCPPANSVSSILDYIGYGSSPGCYFGLGSAPAPSTTTADVRSGFGTINTGNNNTDFTATTPNPRNSAIILPVQLLSFTATLKDNIVAFAWKTVVERNLHHFEIEQSPDGTSFKSIGTVSAAGNATTEKSYRFTGSLHTTTTFYRLKMIDTDGKTTLSSVVKVVPSKTGFSLGNVYPVPAKNSVTVEWNSRLASATTLTLLDISGRTIRTLSLQSISGTNQYRLNVNNLIPGQYILHLKNDLNQMQTIITKE